MDISILKYGIDSGFNGSSRRTWSVGASWLRSFRQVSRFNISSRLGILTAARKGRVEMKPVFIVEQQ